MIGKDPEPRTEPTYNLSDKNAMWQWALHAKSAATLASGTNMLMSASTWQVNPVNGSGSEYFSNWRDRFLVYFDRLEPYLIEILENGPFVPMLPLSTSTNQLVKPQKKWSPEDRRLANQDKRLKSIIISCLPNDIMKYVIKCTTAKAMWIDLVLAHEGPSETKDTKIAALRLKFNAFKALEGEKVNATFTRLKCLLNDLENNGVSYPHAEDSDSDVEEDTRSSSEFLADLNVEFHDRALLANQKKYYKRSRRFGSAKKPNDKTKETCFAYVSSEDKEVTKVKAFMAIAEEEPFVGKNDARSGQWVEITTKKVQRLLSITDDDERKHVLDYTHVDLHYIEDQRKNLLSKFKSLNQELSSLPGNIVHALGGREKKKDTISSKEVLFSKAAESPSETAPKITSDSKSECDIQEPLPNFPKILRAEPNDTSKDDISLADLTLTPTVSDEIKKVPDKRSFVKVLKKKAQPVTSSVPNLSHIKKADLSTEKLLLTLMEEVKGLKEKIKIPSDISPSISQSGSSKAAKGKQKTWFRPCKHHGFRNHLLEECYIKPKCSTCGSTNHLIKEHPEQAAVKNTLAKLEPQSSQGSFSRKAPMILKPFID
ncbi:hypothetical protein Tco_0344110 [Tanacetum coccineum]